MATQTKKSFPTEQLVVLVSEHVELYDMTNKLYHNIYHKESIWKTIGGILGHYQTVAPEYNYETPRTAAVPGLCHAPANGKVHRYPRRCHLTPKQGPIFSSSTL